MFSMSVAYAIHYALQVVTIMRAITRENREPASRIAWVLVIMAIPVVGIVLYYLFGETKIGRRKFDRLRAVIRQLPPAPVITAVDGAVAPAPQIGSLERAAFARVGAVNGFAPLGGNRARLPADEAAAIEELIADIDAATDHVHLLFYIWLLDGNGRKVLDAVRRAAARGVTCRCLIDGLGSRKMARSKEWAALRAAGVRTAITFDTKWLLAHLFYGRVDIRNHRKIAVIDGDIGYCGSQNCADREFLVKAKYAPWVDVLLRVEGPVVWQMQYIFISDWMTHAGEDIADMLERPVIPFAKGFTAIAVGTGPIQQAIAVPDLFVVLLASAQNEIFITTPYYVPDESLHRQICSAAIRGVKVTMVLPARNDSFFVGWGSRSYYGSLLRAGVRLMEFQPGLLHAKTMTVDERISFIGSANMDRRSFELNFENNMLISDARVTWEIRARQHRYIAQSRTVTLEEVRAWHMPQRLSYNIAATFGPLL